MTRIDDELLTGVAVLPLPHIVLFPEVLLPLHIFEPRYRAMLSDCLDNGRALVIAQLDRESGRIADVAGVGLIVDHRPLPDGRANIVVAGAARVRLDELFPEELPRYPYQRARTTRLDELDIDVANRDRTGLIAAATMFVTEIKKHDPSFGFHVHAEQSVGVLADACAYHLVVDASARQSILEELDPRVRVRMVMDQLARQHSAMLADVSAVSRGPRGGSTILN